MTQTARAWLEELTSLSTPLPTEFEAALRQRAAIEAHLDADVGLHDMVEVGSLLHGTGVSQCSDPDYLASLEGDRPENPWTMLEKVRGALAAHYPATNFVIRRPAVVCHFPAAILEIIPAYPCASGYRIADPAGGWMKTYPRNHSEYLNEVDRTHRGAVKALARQMKIWKYRRNVPVSSCYLEMRSARHMDGETTYSPLWDLYVCLKKMFEVALASMNDPTGLDARFSACSTELARQEALSELGTAVAHARKAKDCDTTGNHEDAIEQLRLLFEQ